MPSYVSISEAHLPTKSAPPGPWSSLRHYSSGPPSPQHCPPCLNHQLLLDSEAQLTSPALRRPPGVPSSPTHRSDLGMPPDVPSPPAQASVLHLSHCTLIISHPEQGLCSTHTVGRTHCAPSRAWHTIWHSTGAQGGQEMNEYTAGCGEWVGGGGSGRERGRCGLGQGGHAAASGKVGACRGDGEGRRSLRVFGWLARCWLRPPPAPSHPQA